MKSQIGIVSYSDKLHLPTSLNHQYYSDLHGYTYILDISPPMSVNNETLPSQRHGYFSKIQKVRKFLPLFDWVLWVDDDVLFTDFSKTLDEVISGWQEFDFLICNSPIGLTGKWTYVNSGVFLVKNTTRSLGFLDSCLQVNFNLIREWWDDSQFGYFTNADQDAITYNLIQNPNFSESSGFWHRLDFGVMNNRVYHYKETATEHFILHLAGVPDKKIAMEEFSARFNINPLFVPDSVANNYRFNKQEKVEKSNSYSFINRFFKRINRLIVSR